MADIMEAVRAAAEAGDDVLGLEFEGGALEGASARSLAFSKCVFKNVRFGDNDVKHLSFADCIFNHCDLSGLRLSDGSVHATQIKNCRGVGAQFDGSVLKNVAFVGCQLNYMTIASCKLASLTFRDCSLEKLMLHTCQQKGLKIENCSLASAEIADTSLLGVDLSSDDIGGIRVSPRDLAGAKASLLQAALVCALVGVEIV
jgi:uncharacterized protein YjbI with pentapeptide repeats